MARKQSPDYDRRKENIVAKASVLFAHRGFLGTSVSDLAAACSTSKALVYHYFGSKEDILYAVMSNHLDALLEAVEKVESLGSFTPAEKLRHLTHEFVALYVGAADFQKVLLNDLENLPPELNADIVKRQRRIVESVDAAIVGLTANQAADEITPMTMLYFGMINWAHTWYDPSGPMKPERLADLVVSLFLDGLRGQ